MKKVIIVIVLLCCNVYINAQNICELEEKKLINNIIDTKENFYTYIIDAGTRTFSPPELKKKLIEYSIPDKGRAAFIEAQEKSIKKFDSFLNCANNKVRELVKDKKAPINLLGVLNQIEKVYNNFKIILRSSRSQYKKNKKLVQPEGLVKQLSSDREVMYFLLRSFLDEIPAPQDWQKDPKLFQGYSSFFKTYDDFKKKLSVVQLQDIEVENFLKLLEVIPLEIMDKKSQTLRALSIDEERRFATQFVDKLHQFIVKKNKSWYLTGSEKKMISNAKEIIIALNNRYQIISDLDNSKWFIIKEPAKQILTSELVFLLEMLSTLIDNINNLI